MAGADHVGRQAVVAVNNMQTEGSLENSPASFHILFQAAGESPNLRSLWEDDPGSVLETTI